MRHRDLGPEQEKEQGVFSHKISSVFFSEICNEVKQTMRALILAALISVVVAHPGLVPVGPAGPAPAPEPEDAFQPIAIGPAILDNFHPIAIGPAIVPDPVPIVPEPVAVGPAIIPAPKAPLVQIILNVNAAASAPAPVPVLPVHVVDEAPAPIDPVQVVEVAPEPEPEPIPVEPVVIGEPSLPEPVVSPPELN
ncbi:unnamed protein product [Spodoptera exigua]|nr:unnamed protein product [Spodoptera exigua]